jgi:hypothetical protein
MRGRRRRWDVNLVLNHWPYCGWKTTTDVQSLISDFPACLTKRWVVWYSLAKAASTSGPGRFQRLLLWTGHMSLSRNPEQPNRAVLALGH